MKVNDIKNKTDLIQFVKEQVNIELENNDKENFNKKKNVLYTNINRRNQYSVLPLLAKYKFRIETHINDNYWIYVKGAC